MLVTPNIRFDKTELGVVNHHEPSRRAGFIRHPPHAMPNDIRVERPVAVNLTSTPDEGAASSARDAGVELGPSGAWLLLELIPGCVKADSFGVFNWAHI
jgi:hypothetical protein